MNGYAGTILHVDLTEEKIWKEALDEELIEKYLGGRGINARLLWENVDHQTEALSPDNVLIFGAGALSGTDAPCSGRLAVAFKSPATNAYFKASGGGYVANELKYAGYDHVVIYGRAKRPMYLYISKGKVELRDANALWGKTVTESDAALKKELKTPRLETLLIGPAGENLVKFSAIMSSWGSALGRGGGGAVMGSKNLKAIAVFGEGALDVADPKRFGKLSLTARDLLRNDGFAQILSAFGTAGFVEGVNDAGILPSYNFTKSKVENAENFSGQALASRGYLKGRSGCASCAIHCHRYSTVDEGPYAGTKTLGPEYETISSFGNGPGLDNLEAIIKAGQLCNDYGLDSISAGSAIQWLIESVEREVLKKEDVDGLDLCWGAEKEVLLLIEKIAYREGIGDMLAEGTKYASEKSGGDSYKWAVQARGLEQSRCETRGSMAYALAFCVNPRGPDHLHTECIAESGMYPEAAKLIERITGDVKYANPTLTEKRAEIVRWHEDNYTLADALGFCAFVNTAANIILEKEMTELYNAASGRNLSIEEALEAGRRILTLERCFNIREGLSRKDDMLPYRITHTSLGNAEKSTNSPEILNAMLDEYYAMHEWDAETGFPRKETLIKLGLEDVAEELEERVYAETL